MLLLSHWRTWPMDQYSTGMSIVLLPCLARIAFLGKNTLTCKCPSNTEDRVCQKHQLSCASKYTPRTNLFWRNTGSLRNLTRHSIASCATSPQLPIPMQSSKIIFHSISPSFAGPSSLYAFFAFLSTATLVTFHAHLILSALSSH